MAGRAVGRVAGMPLASGPRSSSALWRFALVASVIVCIDSRWRGHGQQEAPSAFLSVAAGAPEPAGLGSKGVARRGLLGLATAGQFGLFSVDANALSDTTKWKEDIPRILNALKALDWKAIQTVGQERAGSEIVRTLLMTRYDEVLDVVSPAGKKVGIVIDQCKVSRLEDPSVSFLEEDEILAVNGQAVTVKGTPVCSVELLQKLVREAKGTGNPIVFSVFRKSDTPFTNIDNKLKELYNEVEGDFADLEDLQGRVSEAKVLAQAGASAPSAGDKYLPKLRQTIEQLIKDFTPLAAVCK